MDYTNDITKIKDLLDKAQDVLVVTHEHPTADSIGSALAVYLGLVGLGKRVTVACPDPVTVGLSSFVGVNKFTQELGKKNFVISLDYVDGSIEKVSYNIEGDKFNLVVEPRTGFEPFTQDKVHFSNAGTAADVIVSLDTIHLGGLKKLYETEKDLFATKPVINIDHHGSNTNYGAVNLVDTLASSTAEIVAHILSGIGVKLTVDIANNFLNALYGATNNFTNAGVSAAAFEVAAVCSKAGAKKFAPSASEEAPSVEVARDIGLPMTPKVAPVQPAPLAPSKAPEDWLKPKIFKSSSVS